MLINKVEEGSQSGLQFHSVVLYIVQHVATLVASLHQTLQKSQYSTTNVMHFLFSLLRIKGLYMFRALLTDLQEVRNKWHLVYCMRVMSVGCTRFGVPSGGAAQMTLGILHQDWSSTPILVQPSDITRMQYTKCSLCSVS
jgi:hypothetical protein